MSLSLVGLQSLNTERFDTVAILKKLASANRQLAELKGIAAAIPNQGILINALGLQEAKDSSEIENIVTTHDELFQNEYDYQGNINPATKEVLNYRQALLAGFQYVKELGLITNNHVISIQAVLEPNKGGFRRLPGTVLKNNSGDVVYTPPQHPDDVIRLMSELEQFINDDSIFKVDPLIKTALIHYQFESIHPFYDGNGRMGRIINVLYLVKEQLLDIPVLYLSRYIVKNKIRYYQLLQAVRDNNAWEDWVLFMLEAVEVTASYTIKTIQAIKEALFDYKYRIREKYKFYSQDLINNLFTHPYTKIDFIRQDLQVSRITATNYLDSLAEGGFLIKQKVGRSNYYINAALYSILITANN